MSSQEGVPAAPVESTALSSQQGVAPTPPDAPGVAPTPDEGLGGITVGSCLSPCAQTLNYEKQEFCHMEGVDLDEHELELLMDHWQLERPNLILEMLGPVGPHPKRMVTKEMLLHHELDPFVKELRDTLGLLGDEPADDDEKIVEALGARLYEKVIQSTIALLRACEQTNSWITFVDGPQTTIPLVREALSRCDARPVIFVCENVDHYSETTDVLGRIFESKTGLALAGHGQSVTTTRISDGWSQEYSESVDESISKQPIAKNPCSFATHYIFSKSSSPINYAKLAPKGTFYMCGGGGCANSMATNVANYQPGVFMLHTGRACDIFGSALHAILSEDCKTADAVVANMKGRIPFEAEEEGRCFGENWERIKLYEYVSGLLSAYHANPNQFKTVTVVLNSWLTTPEDVLNELSQCFAGASAGGASLEVGAADAKDRSIRAVWGIHRSLQHNCRIFKRTADSMTITGTLLALATTVISTSLIAVQMRGGTKTSADAALWVSLSDVMLTLLVLLPAVGGLVITALSRFGYLSKWGTMYMAMIEVESEIWKFRVCSGEYDTSGLQDEEDGKKQKKKQASGGSGTKKGSSPVKKNDPKRLFTARASEAYGRLLGGEMQVDSFQEPDASTPSTLSTPLLIKVESQKLKDAQEGGFDDHVSDLTGECYFAHRLVPQLDALKKQAPRLSRRLTTYEVIILISTLVTTLMATLQLKVWIPVAVAVSGMFASFMQYEALHQQLAAVNGAIADLTRFSTDWAAMGVLERRGRLVKALMVQLTEGSVLRVATAYAGGAGSGRSSASSAEAAEENKNKKKE